MADSAPAGMAKGEGNVPIRLFLVDEYLLFRESLSRLLSAQTDFEITGEYGRPAEALDALQRLPADVILLDRDSRPGSEHEFIASARQKGYAGKFLLVTGGMDPIDALKAVQAGISGVFFKHNSSDALAQAIRLVAAGEVWLDKRIIQFLAGRVLAPPAAGLRLPLAEREEQVLHKVLEGSTNRQIAESLGVSEGAVKAVVQQLFRKSGVRTRSQLVRLALEGWAGETVK